MYLAASRDPTLKSCSTNCFSWLQPYAALLTRTWTSCRYRKRITRTAHHTGVVSTCHIWSNLCMGFVLGTVREWHFWPSQKIISEVLARKSINSRISTHSEQAHSQPMRIGGLVLLINIKNNSEIFVLKVHFAALKLALLCSLASAFGCRRSPISEFIWTITSGSHSSVLLSSWS